MTTAVVEEKKFDVEAQDANHDRGMEMYAVTKVLGLILKINCLCNDVITREQFEEGGVRAKQFEPLIDNIMDHNVHDYMLWAERKGFKQFPVTELGLKYLTPLYVFDMVQKFTHDDYRQLQLQYYTARKEDAEINIELWQGIINGRFDEFKIYQD